MLFKYSAILLLRQQLIDQACNTSRAFSVLFIATLPRRESDQSWREEQERLMSGSTAQLESSMHRCCHVAAGAYVLPLDAFVL